MFTAMKRASVTIATIAILSAVQNDAYSQIDSSVLDPYKNPNALTHLKVPSDRDTAVLWLIYLTDVEYSSLPPELAKSWAACSVSDVQELTDGELKKLFLDAKGIEFKKLEPDMLGAMLRHALAKHQTREETAKLQLFNAAKELAQVAREYGSTDAGKIAGKALKATGYVDHEGTVMLREEAFPYFGILR